MAQSLALLIVEQFSLRGGRLGMQTVLRCEMVIVLIGIRGIEYIERLIVDLDVLESVAGDAYGLAILVDRIKHALHDVADGIGDEVSSVGRVEAIS